MPNLKTSAIVLTAMSLGVCLALVAPAGAQSRAQREAAGAAIYQQDCALCHDNSEHMLNDNGPALFGVVGRKVGSVDGYTYSPALNKARDNGNHWSTARLEKFLANPERMYPGTGMPMNFDNPAARKAIVAYLKTLKAKD